MEKFLEPLQTSRTNAEDRKDEVTCPLETVQPIDASLRHLKSHISGHAPLDSFCNDISDLEGKSTEVLLHIEQWQDVWGVDNSVVNPLLSEETYLGGFSLQLEIHCCADDEVSSQRKKVGAFLSIRSSEGEPVEKILVNYSITAFSNKKDVQTCTSTQDFAKDIQKGCCWGWESFLTETEANKIDGQITFIASCYIAELVITFNDTISQNIDRVSISKKPIISQECNTAGTILYERLADLHDWFVTDMKSLYSNHFFFSEQFYKSLAHMPSLTSDKGLILPGSSSSRMPAIVLRKFRQKAEKSSNEYREKVIKVCKDEVRKNLISQINKHAHPQLLDRLMSKCDEKFKSQQHILANLHTYFIEMEISTHSSNHNFLDTVQSIRKIIFDTKTEKPSYLQHLNAWKIKNMSNEDQKLLDMQIEVFAYYQLMITRFVDNIIMSTYSELVHKQICAMLKKSMIEAVICQSEDEESSWTSSQDSIGEETLCISPLPEEPYKSFEVSCDDDGVYMF